jgi:hypothetical protein
MSFTPLQVIKHVILPLFGLKPRNFNATTTTFMKLLFDSVFDSVLVYCFFSKLGIIDYPTTLVALTLNILFSKMLKISPKKS